MTARILVGDCRDRMAEMDAASVQTCVTSPPYFGLRSYVPDGHPDKHKEIGLEQTPAEYVAALVEVFRAVRRVLRDDGTVWLNLGDSYASSPRGNLTPGGGNLTNSNIGSAVETARWVGARSSVDKSRMAGVKPKDLLGIPWRVAFALQDDGWYLRSEIIWAKPNPMPESVTDRPTKAHEYVFLLTKSARYCYDADAIAEPVTGSSVERLTQPTLDAQAGSWRANGGAKTNGPMRAVGGTGTRNARTVWTIAEPRFRLRSDLTPEQRAHVLRRLAAAGSL